ncbi:sodium:solute symporter [Cetobacterium sp.]|uniref:sodium:solute symporter n=1 Tax=Cetobacterium sp. TaxID=2071632 RepID=UPI003F3CC808
MNWNWLNWIVIFIYFSIILGIGIYFNRKNKNTEDYFRGSGSIPTLVTACSIYATSLSSLSFIGIPGSVYKNGWIMGMAPLGIILMVIWAAETFVPFFRELKVETAYEYLEIRFGKEFRVIGSLSFIIFHIIRIAIILYLPVLALSIVLPSINPTVLVVLVSSFCIVYTSLGGIKAVVWSDAFQTIVLLLGASVIIFLGISSIPKNVDIVEVFSMKDMIKSPEIFKVSFSGKTLLGMIVGGFLNSIYSYVGSQDIVQRYATTESTNEAKKSLYMNIPLLLISIFIFVGMGSGLYMFFKYSVTLPQDIVGNAILPYFVINYIPKGLSGLVIAAIFAATQSTVSSSLNSISVCITSDLLKSVTKCRCEKIKLKIAKCMSWAVGILSSLLALRFLKIGQSDIFLYFQSITGLLGGPIAGIFLVGIFIKKADRYSAWIGFLVSLLTAFYIGNPMQIMNIFSWYREPKVFEFLISLFVIGNCVLSAWIISFMRAKD